MLEFCALIRMYKAFCVMFAVIAETLGVSIRNQIFIFKMIVADCICIEINLTDMDKRIREQMIDFPVHLKLLVLSSCEIIPAGDFIIDI